VSQVFDCPFCGGKDLCACTMDFDHSLGYIKCDACGAKYEMQINRLSEAIDVYSEWIDMCATTTAPSSPPHLCCARRRRRLVLSPPPCVLQVRASEPGGGRRRRGRRRRWRRRRGSR
jgi:hypothetical protein